MFDKLRRNIYFNRLDSLFEAGIEDGRIVPFDEDFYKELSNTYVAGLPVSMHIRYLKPVIPPGQCYDRSLYMFFCFDDALLVRGDNKDLEFMYGKDHAGHGWIERGDYVYDPTLMMRFDKDLYYCIYKPTNIVKADKDKYCSIGNNKELYDDVVSTTIDDFKPNGRKRIDLIMIMPVLKCIAEKSDQDGFIAELSDFMERIEYDEVEICEELDTKLKQYLM